MRAMFAAHNTKKPAISNVLNVLTFANQERGCGEKICAELYRVVFANSKKLLVLDVETGTGKYSIRSRCINLLICRPLLTQGGQVQPVQMYNRRLFPTRFW